MNPKDPRNHPNYHPRGMKRFTYTYEDIAKLLNRSIQTVKNLSSTGKLDPSDLQSIVNNYIKRH